LTRIAIPDDFPAVLASSAAWHGLQSQARLDYHGSPPGSEETLIERIREAEIVLNIRASSRFTAQVFESCPNLRLLSVWGTGTDHIDLATAARRGITVTNTPGVSAVSIAEHALALLFGVARRLSHIDAATRAGRWERGQFVQLRGKTCGIVGHGAIGREFARIATGIGMNVILWTMHPERYPGIAFTALDDLYAASDVISLHLRLTPPTENFLTDREFRRMKPSAILINTARGALVQETALLEALSTHRIAGAGLDVFATEPLPAGHPLTGLDNVVLSPHCAGITPEAMEAGLAMAVENIWSFLAGTARNMV
jgi:D-3-phosphoglycerate dehydrogenase